MRRILVVTGVCAVVLIVMMLAAQDDAQPQPQPSAQPAGQARIEFLRKCIRNVTPDACNAPGQARVLTY